MKRALLFLAGLAAAVLAPFVVGEYHKMKYCSYYPERVPKALRWMFR